MSLVLLVQSVTFRVAAQLAGLPPDSFLRAAVFPKQMQCFLSKFQGFAALTGGVAGAEGATAHGLPPHSALVMPWLSVMV
jgi:hypothetical protein